jgi:hypothetical protein
MIQRVLILKKAKDIEILLVFGGARWGSKSKSVNIKNLEMRK